MITSILDRDFKGNVFEDMDNERGVQHLGAIFNKLCLPVPDDDEVQVTREKGFNLFLNHYGCVVRFYEREYTIPDTDIKTANEHLHHQKSLPFIGHVRFDTFNMQVMPGVMCAESLYCEELLLARFNQDFANVADAGIENLGHLSTDKSYEDDLILLDTVMSIDEFQESYQRYLKNNVEQVIERSAFIKDLQRNFYEAWTSGCANDMKQFWSNIREIHQQGERLHVGWLEKDNMVLYNVNKNKENFIAKSKSYDQRHLAYSGG